jgi:O-antigen/teichoic acid export membrane protein
VSNPVTSSSDAVEEASFSQLSFKQLVKRTAGHSSVYTVGTFASGIVALMLIPIYWRHLDPADYGIIALAGIISAFFSVVLGLSLSASITRFYYEWPAAERRQRLGTVWILNWFCILVIGIPIAAWGGPIIEIFIKQVPYSPYLLVAMWSTIFASMSNVPLMTLRIAERSSLYVVVTTTALILHVSFSLWFVVGLGLGALGILGAQLTANGIMVVVYLAVMLFFARISFKLNHVHEVVRYSLPLVPGSFLDATGSVMDRFLLDKFVGLPELGLYAVADSLAKVVRMFNKSVKTAWAPFQMRVASERKKEAQPIIARMATTYVVILFVVAVGVAVLVRDVVFIIDVDKYKPVVELVPLFIVAYVILGIGTPIGGGLIISGRTEYTIFNALTYLSILVIANLILTPRIGVFGAIAAMGLGFLSRVMVNYKLSQRFYPIIFEWSKITVIILGALVVYGLARLIPVEPSVAGLILRGLLVIAYAAILGYWVLGGRKYLAFRLNWRNSGA